MRILLTSLNSKFVHTNLALRYLYNSISNQFDTVLKEFTINEEIFRILAGINEIKPDIIAFSCYIWNISYISQLCKCIKKVKPETIIILGGPEVSYDAWNFMKINLFADYIVIGEGEANFPKLIRYIVNRDGKLEDIESIAYRDDNGSIVVSSTTSLIQDLSVVPSAFQGDLSEYRNKVAYYESTRGCPYNCSYCLSSTTRGVRVFPIDRVKNELLRLIDAGAKQIKFVDRTFNADRKRAIEIWKFLLENKKDTTFHFEISGHLIDEETIEFLKQVPEGLFQFEIGVQTTFEKTIEAINRKTDFEKLSHVIKLLRANNNIHIHLDLIAGLPFETYLRFKKSFDDVYRLKPHALQLGFLKLLKGSSIREKSHEHGYKWIEEPPYEVIENKYISFEEILKLKRIEEVLETYKNTGRFEYALEYIIKNHYDSPFDFYEELSESWKSIGIYEKRISSEEAYDVLYEFYIHKNFENCDYFSEVLKLDYNINFFGGSKRHWLKKYKASNLKEIIYDTLTDESFIQKYAKDIQQFSWHDKLKTVNFEIFKYNVIEENDEKFIVILFIRNPTRYNQRNVSISVIKPNNLNLIEN